MTASVLRLRRVRFKDGRTIEVLRRPTDTTIKDALKNSVEDVLSSSKVLQGYALVAWDNTGYVFNAYRASPSSVVHTIQIPQFIKDALIAEIGARWAADE